MLSNFSFSLFTSFFVWRRAVVNHSAGQDLPCISVESFENLPGRGLSATLSRIEVIFHEAAHLEYPSMDQITVYFCHNFISKQRVCFNFMGGFR